MYFDNFSMFSVFLNMDLRAHFKLVNLSKTALSNRNLDLVAIKFRLMGKSLFEYHIYKIKCFLSTKNSTRSVRFSIYFFIFV